MQHFKYSAVFMCFYGKMTLITPIMWESITIYQRIILLTVLVHIRGSQSIPLVWLLKNFILGSYPDLHKNLNEDNYYKKRLIM